MKTQSRSFKPGPASQKGASLYALIFVMTLLGIIIFAGLKISPAYIDDRIISNALRNMRDEGELAKLSLRDTRTRISRTMMANGASWSADYIDQVELNGVDYIQVQYEKRVEMFWNIDAIVKFDYMVQKSD
ncbi:MAG: DUF4845 domain-containing protein [Pseudohongiellaceae bacterium]